MSVLDTTIVQARRASAILERFRNCRNERPLRAAGWTMDSDSLMQRNRNFLERALELAYANVAEGGRPFGAVVVKDGKVIASGVNRIVQTNDPTAHAELLAIRAASQHLGSPRLEGCSVFASGHPCPMCMGAMRLAGIGEITYAYSNKDGAPFGLSTQEIYDDLAKPFAEQSMAIRHVPLRLDTRPDLYGEWQHRQQAGGPGR